MKLPTFSIQLRWASALSISLASFSVAADPLASAGKLRPISNVERKVLAPLDLARVRAEDTAEEVLDLPPRFAVPVPVSVRPETAGTWEELADVLVWRFRVESEVASSFNFGFTEFWMPVGAELWVYSPDLSSKFGPYTSANNQPHRQLWTPVVLGNEAVIELSYPLAGAKPVLHRPGLSRLLARRT